MLAPFSGPWLVCTTKVYPGLGADIVMESIALIDARQGLAKSPVIACSSGPSKFAGSQLLCSSSVSSLARCIACRSGQDSRLSSCGGGTFQTRTGLAKPSPAPTTPHLRETRLEARPGRRPLSTECSRTEQHPRGTAQVQTDSPSPSA